MQFRKPRSYCSGVKVSLIILNDDWDPLREGFVVQILEHNGLASLCSANWREWIARTHFLYLSWISGSFTSLPSRTMPCCWVAHALPAPTLGSFPRLSFPLGHRWGDSGLCVCFEMRSRLLCFSVDLIKTPTENASVGVRF